MFRDPIDVVGQSLPLCPGAKTHAERPDNCSIRVANLPYFNRVCEYEVNSIDYLDKTKRVKT